MKKIHSLLSLLVLLGVTNEAFCRSLSGDAANVERPGPSNRRSPFVISEIMYHPAPQEGGANLEFIEIFNSQPWWEEVGGFRIDGDINYGLPPGTRIEKLNYLVIASDPEAVKKAYGLENVLGPYTGRLSNGGGRLRLRNNLDAVLFEVNYDTRAPWPSGNNDLFPSQCAQLALGQAVAELGVDYSDWRWPFQPGPRTTRSLPLCLFYVLKT